MNNGQRSISDVAMQQHSSLPPWIQKISDVLAGRQRETQPVMSREQRAHDRLEQIRNNPATPGFINERMTHIRDEMSQRDSLQRRIGEPIMQDHLSDNQRTKVHERMDQLRQDNAAGVLRDPYARTAMQMDEIRAQRESVMGQSFHDPAARSKLDEIRAGMNTPYQAPSVPVLDRMGISAQGAEALAEQQQQPIADRVGISAQGAEALAEQKQRSDDGYGYGM